MNQILVLNNPWGVDMLLNSAITKNDCNRMSKI